VIIQPKWGFVALLKRFLFECRQHSIEELKNLRAEIAEDFQKSSSYKQQWRILDRMNRMGVQKNHRSPDG